MVCVCVCCTRVHMHTCACVSKTPLVYQYCFIYNWQWGSSDTRLCLSGSAFSFWTSCLESLRLFCVILMYPGASLLGLWFLIHKRRGYISVMLAAYGLGARWHRCSFLELHNLSSLTCSNRFYHSSEDLKPAIKVMAAGLPHDSFPVLAVGSCWQTFTWGSLSVFKVPPPPRSLLVSLFQLYTYEETCHGL